MYGWKNTCTNSHYVFLHALYIFKHWYQRLLASGVVLKVHNADLHDRFHTDDEHFGSSCKVGVHPKIKIQLLSTHPNGDGKYDEVFYSPKHCLNETWKRHCCNLPNIWCEWWPSFKREQGSSFLSDRVKWSVWLKHSVSDVFQNNVSYQGCRTHSLLCRAVWRHCMVLQRIFYV